MQTFPKIGKVQEKSVDTASDNGASTPGMTTNETHKSGFFKTP
jgi:hypothetical protein